MQFLLDTNICIYIAKQKPLAVLEKFQELTINDVGMSIITYAELLYGCQKSLYKHKALAALQRLIAIIPVLELPNTAALSYAETRHKLEQQGAMIGNNDLWIAAHALSLELVLVTNNVKEFSRINDLEIENWVHETETVS